MQTLSLPIPLWTRVAVAFMPGLLIMAAMAAYVTFMYLERERLRPPAGVTSLQEFAEAMPPPHKVSVVQFQGQRFIVWEGDEASRPVVASGPASYLFDASGTLVGWCWQTGEGDPFEAYWYKASLSEPISLDAAFELVRDGAGNAGD